MGRFLRPLRRVAFHPIFVAVSGLLWLLLRSGRKPSRMSYPCQQAALGSATLVLGVPAAHLFHRAMRRFRGRPAAVAVLAVAAVGMAAWIGPGDMGSVSWPRIGAASISPFPDYRATVYAVHDVGGPNGDHHEGVDQLLSCMDGGGLSFYQSESGLPETDPDGIVGAGDLVLIKINQQWDERGGTNTDVLRGIIARIVEHPDAFTGEIVVVENTQSRGSFDWANSNAEDTGQSALDVVNHFAGLGWRVSTYLWDPIRSTSVAEYADGDMTDGYVVEPYDSETQISVSYPKFQTAEGQYVSLKHGIWDPSGGVYDDSEMTFINVPVLKCHGAVYGVTAAVKHHVGTMTVGLDTNTHFGVRYGGLGRFLADVRMADLNILDCIYILAQPNSGPWCSYEQATRVDKLVAGVDPVALDLWATKHILVPTIVDNGYSDYPKQDPDDPSSIFRTYLDRSAIVMLMAGIPVTNDLAQIDAIECGVVSTEPGTTGQIGPRAFPNPTRTGAAIRFDMEIPSTVRVEIYDGSGRLVRSMTEAISAGPDRTMYWDGRDGSGRILPTGVYSYRVIDPRATRSGKLTLLR